MINQDNIEEPPWTAWKARGPASAMAKSNRSQRRLRGLNKSNSNWNTKSQKPILRESKNQQIRKMICLSQSSKSLSSKIIQKRPEMNWIRRSWRVLIFIINLILLWIRTRIRSQQLASTCLLHQVTVNTHSHPAMSHQATIPPICWPKWKRKRQVHQTLKSGR